MAGVPLLREVRPIHPRCRIVINHSVRACISAGERKSGADCSGDNLVAYRLLDGGCGWSHGETVCTGGLKVHDWVQFARVWVESHRKVRFMGKNGIWDAISVESLQET